MSETEQYVDDNMEANRRRRIVREIWLERMRQTRLWGDQWEHGNTHDETKMVILAEEVGEVAKAVLEVGKTELRKELIQTAAVCVAWLESLDPISASKEPQ